MSKKFLKKIGYFEIFEVKLGKIRNFEIDSGKVIFSSKFKKYIPNPYRDVKKFKTLAEAEKYIKNKLKKRTIPVIKPKSLYLIIIKELETDKLFIKVGITSKKYIINRFSKEFGYKNYKVESILRRINTPDAEALEEKIKEKLNKKKTIKKYKPLLESFSGYSECYEHNNLNEIINIFDELTKNYV